MKYCFKDNMRRKNLEITDFKKMIKILNNCDCCRIGLVDEYGAYIIPMNFGYEIKENKLILYFHSSNEGKKIDLIKKQEIVSFEMDNEHRLVPGDTGCNYSFSYKSIMGRGEIEIIQEIDEKINAIQKIMQHYTNKQDWTFKKEKIKITTVIKINVTQWSCKEH